MAIDTLGHYGPKLTYLEMSYLDLWPSAANTNIDTFVLIFLYIRLYGRYTQ
jgi:hypothetical protein